MPQERILIVDDEEDMLEGLRRIFSQHLSGVEVTTASRARQALRLVRQVPVDLVLLDIRMPEMDGFELLESLRERGPLAHRDHDDRLWQHRDRGGGHAAGSV